MLSRNFKKHILSNAETVDNGILVNALIDILNRDMKLRNRRFYVIALLFFLGPTVYLFSVNMLYGNQKISDDYAALIRIDGEIKSGGKVSAEKTIPALRKAFNDERAKGVLIKVNSPGGSPVQSHIIRDRIIQLTKAYHDRHPNKPVRLVIEDYGTSGAYLIATGVEIIYANQSSIVGSIGVIMDGFGVNLDKKLGQWGIERRQFTAGEHKARMDMFSPLKSEDIEKTNTLLSKVHKQFIDAVKQSRGKRLNNNEKIFSGDYWTGTEAVSLGLVDGIRNTHDILQEEYGVTDVVDYTPQPSIFSRLSGSYGVSLMTEFFNILMTETNYKMY
ncbi:MAG: S49 family peptidase [Gammaproteobacteria bacterium]|nr:S49 family peptidase [Gammaproteobacteria bacterium]